MKATLRYTLMGLTFAGLTFLSTSCRKDLCYDHDEHGLSVKVNLSSDWEQEWEDFWGYDGSKEDSQDQEPAPDQTGNSSEQDIQEWQEEQQRQNEEWFEEQQRQQDEWLRQQQEQMYQ